MVKLHLQAFGQNFECLIKVCSNGGATYIIVEIIAKKNLHIVKLMRTFKNLLQNYLTKFLDIAYK